MKHRVFLHRFIVFSILALLMLGSTVQSAKAGDTCVGFDWSGYLPQSSYHDFGTHYFNPGNVIYVEISPLMNTTYPNTDILMNEMAHEIHAGTGVPGYIKIVIPESGIYHFYLFNGFAHSDGGVKAVVSCSVG